MANLIVTYAKAQSFKYGRPAGNGLHVLKGSGARTEEIAIAGASDVGELVAAGDDVVYLTALAACWVAVGESPVAVAGECHYFAEGATRPLGVEDDEAVAVIQA